VSVEEPSPGGWRVGRKPFKTPDEKLKVVLSVLRGEMTQVEAARRLEMSQTTIAKWQKQFLEGARESLARGENATGPTSKREEELQSQMEELTQALGEAYVELRVWREGGALYPATRSSRRSG
jgi:transposase